MVAFKNLSFYIQTKKKLHFNKILFTHTFMRFISLRQYCAINYRLEMSRLLSIYLIKKCMYAYSKMLNSSILDRLDWCFHRIYKLYKRRALFISIHIQN